MSTLTPSLTLEQELTRALDLALLERVRRHELGIAYLRAALFTVGAALDLALSSTHLSGASIGDLTGELVFTIPILGFVIWLRRGGWRPWVPLAAAAWDAIFSAGTYLDPALRMPADQFAAFVMPTVIPFACVLIAAAGLRFRREAVWGTAGTFALLYAALALRVDEHIPVATHIYSGFFLFFLTLAVDRLTVAVKDAVGLDVGKQVLERFLPSSVIEQAIVDPVGLVSAPRTTEVTVLVSDLRGFTKRSEGMAPAEVLRFLNVVQGALADIVREEGGIVDKFLGDGMLAVFGALEPMPDHAARGLAALRRMQAVPERLAAQLGPVAIGVGLHSGQAVVGVLGCGNRMEFTVLGDAVNTASRLESMTKEHGVTNLVSGDVVLRAGQAGLRRIGDAAVRGRVASIELWTLDAPKG